MGNMRKHLRGLLSRPDQWKTFMKAGLIAGRRLVRLRLPII